MGMTIVEFADINLGELNNKIRGYNKAKQERIDNDMFLARWQTCKLINFERQAHGIKKRIKEQDLFLFKGEKDYNKAAIPSKKRRLELKAITDKWANPKNKKTTFKDQDEANKYIASLK